MGIDLYGSGKNRLSNQILTNLLLAKKEYITSRMHEKRVRQRGRDGQPLFVI